MKEKLRSYEFWVSVISAVLIVIQAMSLKIDIPHVTEITTAFLGALSVAGILKKNKTDEVEEIENNVKDEKNNNLNNVQDEDKDEKKKDNK